jgi:clan AA aspartic protease (TIGR02281 family)
MRIWTLSWLLALLVAAPARAAPDHVGVAQAPSGDAIELSRLRPLALQGEANAQYRVGVLYLGRQELIEAARFFKMAANQGHPEAQYRLAALTCSGLGVPRNIDECIRLFRLAADAGVAQAQVILATRYFRGDGVPKDHAEAARLARLAAAKGDSMGQYLLGVYSEVGAGVPKDKDEALRLYKLSADQGNDLAQKSLQRLSGQAVPPEKPTTSATTIAVALDRRDGVLAVPAIINQDFKVRFVVDGGASDVVVSETIVTFLRKGGTISDADFTGDQPYQLANGSILKSRTFVLRTLAVGNLVLENVQATVGPHGAMILGQSFLQRFSSWSIDIDRQLLLLREKQ